MAAHGSSLLLQLYMLLLLAHPLDPSSYPERNTDTSRMLPEDFELEETDPELITWMSKILELVDVLMLGIFLGWSFGRKPWRCWKKKKRQSPSVRARPHRRRAHGCPKKLMQLLRQNRDIMRLCLHHSIQQRPRTKMAVKVGTWRRLRISPRF